MTRRCRPPRRSNRGFVLLGVYSMVALALLWLNVFAVRAITQNTHTTIAVRSTQAVDLARAGVEQFREDLYRFLYDRVYLSTANAPAAMTWLDLLQTNTEDPPFDPYNATPSTHQLASGYDSRTVLPNGIRPEQGWFRVQLATTVDPIVVPDGPDADLLPDSATCASATSCDVTVVSTAEVGGIRRSIQATVRVALGASQVFKYVYFVNNYGYFSGNAIRHDLRIHGDMRSNGNMVLSNINNDCWNCAGTLSGDVYAARTPSAAGTITLTGVESWSRATYLTNIQDGSIGNNTARTVDPYRKDDPTAIPTDLDFPSKGPFAGYKATGTGSPTTHPGGNPISVPALGDLSTYQDLAKNWKRKDGGTGSRLRYIDPGADGFLTHYDAGPDGTMGTADDVLVPSSDDREVTITGVYDGVGDTYRARNYNPVTKTFNWAAPAVLSPDGPDGVPGTPDDKTLIVWGKYSCDINGSPLNCGKVEIEGPVVIPGDAIVTGGIWRGQGTIYAGRNLHITGTIWQGDESTTYYPVIWQDPSNPSNFSVRCLQKGSNPSTSVSTSGTLTAVNAWVNTNCM